jgi:hypothetical protein
MLKLFSKAYIITFFRYLQVSGIGKVTPVDGVKAYRGSRGTVGRFHLFYRPRRPLGRYRYSCTLLLDLGTRRGEGSASRLGRFLPPGKTRYPLYRRLGGPQGRS